MLEHIRYEAVQAINFVRNGNTWPERLPVSPDVQRYTQQALLEAALIHFRNLIEFLGTAPKSDRVKARDYLPRDWDWRATDELTQVKQLHGRLAHLGIVRHDGGPFDWRSWLDHNALTVLAEFREFLRRLETVDRERYQRLVHLQPGRPDLLAELDALLDERAQT